ncbi:MAG: ABC transporter permease subunit [Polyangiaceae bacterium]|nr:ABC transporter permease subunit [Polyangiaceae bacterium]
MSLLSSASILAKIAWLRLVRGRTYYITIVLALVPLLLAALEQGSHPKSPWNAAVEATLRFVVPLGAAIHVSGAVGDELEQRTFTYLWSRPIPRSSVVVGRLLIMIPLLFALSVVVLGLSFAIASTGVDAEDFARAIGACAASTIVCCIFAVGGGALFPRQPMLFTIGVFLTVEQFLFAIPAAKYLSIVAHSRVLAGLDPEDTNMTAAAVGLTLLGAIWLAIALFRVSTAEYAAAKE